MAWAAIVISLFQVIPTTFIIDMALSAHASMSITLLAPVQPGRGNDLNAIDNATIVLTTDNDVADGRRGTQERRQMLCRLIPFGACRLLL